MVVYCLTNKINGKKYIGKTIDYEKRMGEHKRDFRKYNRLISRAINKYGWENFDKEVIECVNVADDLCELEKKYIKEHNTLHPNGYNLTEGGEGGVLSEESRKICSIKKKEWWDNNPEQKKITSKRHKGKKVSKESIEKMKKNMPHTKKVFIEGVIYSSIREAARQIGESRQFISYRVKSNGFPKWRVL